MKTRIQLFLPLLMVVALVALLIVPPAIAQPGGPQVVSPEVSPERKLTFRILAPKAEKVQLGGSGDIPGTGFGQSTPLTKGSNG